MENEGYDKKNSPQCDLAIEAHEMLAAGSCDELCLDGVKLDEETEEGYIKITRVKIDTESGAESLGKPIGKYTTIEMPSRFYGQQEIYEKMCKRCALEIEKIINCTRLKDSDTVLVVGLGNRDITADSLGPKVIGALMITRHLKKYMPEEIEEGVRPVCAIAPGVLGTTGMETEEIIRGLTDKIEPKLVIVIDALCSGKLERINTTIQITDTGITPGAGVGNKRKTINSETLGVPVIAIGVPTVVDAATIAAAGMELAFRESDSICHSSMEKIREAIQPEFGNMIVTPKDVDSITDDISSVIANGINISLHKGITLQDIDRYV